VFALFARRRAPTPVSIPSLTAAPTATSPDDPEAQVELVCQTVQKLDEVQRLVRDLPEIPAGDRQTLLAQLASTADSLRFLYFLDAIY
jgi:hypothetical protein